MTTDEWLKTLQDRAVDGRVTLTRGEYLDMVADLMDGEGGAVQWTAPNELPEDELPRNGLGIDLSYQGRWHGIDIHVR